MRLLLSSAILALLSWGTALAATPSTPPTWDGCLQRYAEDLRIDPNLFRAIVYTESGNKPYAFGWTDHQGVRHSVFPDTLHAAKQQLDILKRSPYRFDSGLAQINSRNVSRLGKQLEISHADLLHPCTNLYMSSVILRETLDRHAYTWKAIAAYNGSDDYIGLVWRNLCKRHQHASCQASGGTARTAPLPTDPLVITPVVATAVPVPPTPRLVTTEPPTSHTPDPAPIISPQQRSTEERPSSPSPITHEEVSMLTDAFTQALPAMFTTLTLCLRVLLPFTVFVTTIVLFAYGLRIILWAIRSVTTRLRSSERRGLTQDAAESERWRTSPALSSRLRGAV